MNGRPKFAIVDNNTLAMIGLKQMLEDVMPIMEIHTFNSFEELMTKEPESYVHYFVATNIAIENRNFFYEHRHTTIVLTTSNDPNSQMKDFRCLSVNIPEGELVKALLQLEQYGHSHGRNLPEMPKSEKAKLLSDREIEVLSLVAQGKINKEIADMLNIGLTTVITHRKNIQEKLKLKTVSALTIYAVMHGYVDINKI